MTNEELLTEHRRLLAHHEAEANKHRLAVAALEGKPLQVQQEPQTGAPAQAAADCNCAEHAPKIIVTLPGAAMICGTVSFWFCPKHGLMPPVQVYPTFPVVPAPMPVEPWQPAAPWNPFPGLPWYGQGHGGNCACPQCVPPIICNGGAVAGVFEVHTDFAALPAAGFQVSVCCAPPPFFPSGGVVNGISLFPSAGLAAAQIVS